MLNPLSKFRAFTLLELLTATAVMALLLLALLQITNHTLQASRLTVRQLDSTQSARRAMDVISGNLANAVMTDGATILFQASRDSAPRLAFLTRGRGAGPAPARFLSVGYQLGASGHLLRSYASVPWTATDFLASAGSATAGPPSILATGILQFTVLAQLEDGTIQELAALPASARVSSGSLHMGRTVPAGWSAIRPFTPPWDARQPRVISLRVALASVDEQSFALLSDAQKNLFTQPVSAQEMADPVKFWEDILRGASLPGPARSGIRFHNKTIRLP